MDDELMEYLKDYLKEYFKHLLKEYLKDCLAHSIVFIEQCTEPQHAMRSRALRHGLL